MKKYIHETLYFLQLVFVLLFTAEWCLLLCKNVFVVSELFEKVMQKFSFKTKPRTRLDESINRVPSHPYSGCRALALKMNLCISA